MSDYIPVYFKFLCLFVLAFCLLDIQDICCAIKHKTFVNLVSILLQTKYLPNRDDFFKFVIKLFRISF